MATAWRLPPRFGGPVEPLGQGGFGTVYRAVDLETGRPVAIKVPYRSAGKDLAQEVVAEVQAIARIRHPGVIQVLDVGADDEGYPYLVLEYAGLGSMESFLQRGPPPWPVLLGVLLDLLDAIGHAHALGIVHRDIKAQNVLLADGAARPVPKLADFGLARLRERHGAGVTTQHAAGTILYMAPEIFEGDAGIDPTCDLYAFGVLLYLLTGAASPWEGDDLGLVLTKAQQEPRPWEPRRGSEVPAGLGSVIHPLLARQPGHRPTLAADVRADLLSIDAGALPAQRRSRHTGVPMSVEAAPFGSPLSESPPTRGAVERRPPTAAVAGMRHPLLVDRNDERMRLWDAARGAAVAPTGLVLTGPPGAGRSRLARWLAETLEERGWGRALHVRFDPERPAGESLSGAMRGFLGVGKLDGGRLRARLSAWGEARGDGAPLADRLCAWLDPDLATTRAAPSVRDTSARRLAAIEGVLRRTSTRGVALVWLEETRPTPGVAEFAEELLRAARAAPYPLLVLHESPPGAERLAEGYGSPRPPFASAGPSTPASPTPSCWRCLQVPSATQTRRIPSSRPAEPDCPIC